MEESGQLHISAALPLMPTEVEDGWVPEPVWMLCQKKIPLQSFILTPFQTRLWFLCRISLSRHIKSR